MTATTESLRDVASARDDLLTKRLDRIVPMLMESEGFETWVVAGREYNEDPVLSTMLPGAWLTARRRTILLFTDYGKRRVSISRYPVGDFEPIWDPAAEPDQWQALAAELSATNGPIAINVSSTFALADGLTASERHAMSHALSDETRRRLKGAKSLAIGWLETRLPEERAVFASAVAEAHGLLRRGLSEEAITPGVTTTEDLTWWLRELVRESGHGEWFQPGVLVQRRDGGPNSPWDGYREVVIEPGDLVHVDFGIVDARGYHTDQQQHAYVLLPGESGPPASLTEGMRQANRVQDILMRNMAPGRTGNDALYAAVREARDEGLRPIIYTHPLGLHGHAAGATIGLWDSQDGVPGSGDYPIRVNTGWSIELAAEIDVPEWDGQTVRIMLEEDAFLGEDGIDFLDGRQTEIYPIG